MATSQFPNTFTGSSSGGGTPGGSDTQVQYNNAGAFGGITGATTNGTALTLVAPVLGTPASGNLSNCTALPVGSVTGLGTGVATFLATPSSANLASALTDETGTGAAVFGTGPTLTGADGTTAVTVTGGTQTGSSTPALSLTQTWNNAATTFTAVNVAVTDTASNANSRLISIKRGATEVFGIRIFEGATFLTSATTENPLILTGSSGGQVILGTDSTGILNVSSLTSVSRINVGSDTGSFGLGASQDVLLFRDAADVLALRRTTVAQEFRTYGYFSSTSSRTYGLVKAAKEALTLSGATSATANLIPVGAFVIGVATTTTTTITGASGYTVGDGSDADRWGDITGTAVGTSSDNTNSTANPTGYFAAAAAITLTAKTSNFTGGVAQVTVFYLSTGAD